MFTTKLNQLKVAYEQYFMGMERIAPLKLHDEVAAIIRKYSGQVINNTALKFRYNSLVARYNSYQTYWNRVMKQIEEGSYARSQFRANLKGSTINPNNAPAESQKRLTSSKDPMDLLYSSYVEARKKNKESVDGITRDSLRSVISKQTDVIRKKFSCSKVSFKVVTEGGKTKIKAVPKK